MSNNDKIALNIDTMKKAISGEYDLLQTVVGALNRWII